MKKQLRIATRGSTLALWQANAVKQKLEANGQSCIIKIIESTGDKNITTPIYAFGIKGVFTKELDTALLTGEADIAVHSLKDVPTTPAEGLLLAAVLERGAHEDVLLIKNPALLQSEKSVGTIATSSLRRKAQWLAKYPQHQTVPIRGNIPTRLKKWAEDENIDGLILAKAGLERIHLLPQNAIALTWMIPAPAQGVIGITCRQYDAEILQACKAINHRPTQIAAQVERMFMKTLLAGCSVPVSALATVVDENIHFHGAVHAIDGSVNFEVKHTFPLSSWTNAGNLAAEILLQQTGAQQLIEHLRNNTYEDTEH